MAVVSAGAALIVAVGCSSIVSTSNLSGSGLSATGARSVAHLHSDIWGIYFLGFESCPVITGSYSKPGSYHFFRNTATTNAAAEMVLEESRKMGADAVLDLKTDWDSSWQAATLIFWLKEAQASGNAVILAGEEGEPDAASPGAEAVEIEDPLDQRAD